MASYPTQTTLPTAVTATSSIPLRDRHISTTNFMDLSVAFCREMPMRSSIDNLNMRSFARLDTMRAPTQGDAIVNSRAYFVPYRTVWPAWTDFRAQVPHTFDDGFVGIPSAVPTIYNRVFVESFINDLDDSQQNEYISKVEWRINDSYSNNFDFTLVTFDGQDTVLHGFNFTAKGARIFKLLSQLGYAIVWDTLPYSPNNFLQHSALMIFSLAKVYMDHYYPSQYANSMEYFEIYKWLDYNNYETPLRELFGYQDLRKFYDFIDKVCYSNDYFVNTWDNPNSPNGGAQNYLYIQDINSESGRAGAAYSPDGFNDSTGPAYFSSVGSITQFGLESLKALSDYCKRNQIVGSRALDRLLAQFGIELSPAKLNRSVYISDFQQSIMFGDVTSTADTEGANLGSYAGKGILPERNANFSYSTDEDGFFMILTSVVPITGYYQGADRHTFHFEFSDFLVPEFDALGTQAVQTRELYVPMEANKMFANNIVPIGESGSVPLEELPDYNQLIFGFAPRYAEMKIGKDRLTGDYRLNSKNAQLEAWHLFRDMDDTFFADNVKNVKHDIDFIRGLDSSQYNRIFNYMDDDTDKIKISHYFDYVLKIPAKQLYDTYEFRDEDKADKVTVDVGGSKAN